MGRQNITVLSNSLSRSSSHTADNQEQLVFLLPRPHFLPYNNRNSKSLPSTSELLRRPKESVCICVCVLKHFVNSSSIDCS